MSDPLAAGFRPRRCIAPGCVSQALIEPREGVMERDGVRAAVWECMECYAVRRMPWPKGRADADL